MGEISLKSSYGSARTGLIITLLQIFSIVLVFALTLQDGTFIVDTGAFPLLAIFVGTLLLIPMLTFLMKKVRERIFLYFVGLEIFLFAIIIPVFSRDWYLLPLISLPLISVFFKVDRKYFTGWYLRKMAIFVCLTLIMYFLGSLVQFIIQPTNAPISLVSLKDVFIFPGEQFPILFFLGMNIYGSALTITISPLTIIVFSIVSALVAENYEGFFAVLNRNGSGSVKSAIFGITAALSCQCEACISLLPAMVFVIVSATMIPLILESLLLLILSNLMIRRFSEGKTNSLFADISAWFRSRVIIFAGMLTLVATPLELYGLYLGWLHSPVFFFGVTMLNTLSGYVLMLAASPLVKKIGNMPTVISLVVSGSILSFVWYIPELTYYAITSGVTFSIMAISGLVAGLLFGLAHSITRNSYVIPEAVSLIYGIFVIIIFYFSIDFRLNIWPEFSYTQTAIFEIISWAVMLPLMWIFTQIALYISRNKPLEFNFETPA